MSKFSTGKPSPEEADRRQYVALLERGIVSNLEAYRRTASVPHYCVVPVEGSTTDLAVSLQVEDITSVWLRAGKRSVVFARYLDDEFGLLDVEGVWGEPDLDQLASLKMVTDKALGIGRSDRYACLATRFLASADRERDPIRAEGWRSLAERARGEDIVYRPSPLSPAHVARLFKPVSTPKVTISG